MSKALAKIQLNEIVDHFVKTWKFPDGAHCHKYEWHLDVINKIVIFDMDIEVHKTQDVAVTLKKTENANDDTVHNNHANGG